MIAKENDKVFRILIATVGITLSVILLGLLVYYFWGNFGLLPTVFPIEQKSDAIQIGALFITLSTAILVTFYVWFTKKQVDKLTEQSNVMNQQLAIIKDDLSLKLIPTVIFKMKNDFSEYENFDEKDEEFEFFIVRYSIENVTENTGIYTLKLTPLTLPDEYMTDVNYENAVENDPKEGPVKINEANSLNGAYERLIQPREIIEGYFRVCLDEFSKYIFTFFNKNSARFKRGMTVTGGTDKRTKILENYAEGKKSEKGALQPDPVWLKFEIVVKNELKDRELYKLLLIYYYKMDMEKNKVYINYIRDEKYRNI